MNRIFFLLLTALFFFSCNRRDEPIGYHCTGAPPACAAVMCIAFWTNFNFTLIDAQTGNDLLFGSNPSLSVADIKLFVKTNSPYREVKLWADSNNNRLYSMTASDTMALQIKNEPLKYLLVKKFCSTDCCSRTVVEMQYEGQLHVADKNQFFRIKR
ncbi:MAG: hypothetical protein K2Q24_16740 [Chitinophagaceae bacterium]|nr:hypothetical protein [Chitinophagaceae bacterium]